MVLLSYGKSQIFRVLTFIVFLFQSGIPSSDAGNYKIYESSLSVVDFKNGLLRVSVEKQKFWKVIDEVAEKTGIRIIANTSSDEDLTINFDYLPIMFNCRHFLVIIASNLCYYHKVAEIVSSRITEQ